MGSSTNSVNFSVRPSKTIERSLVFAGLRAFGHLVDLADAVYVGLGSVWFVDFEHAHRDLGIEEMISIESDQVTYERATFNAPYRTVRVIQGMSHDEVPKLLEREDLADRPWIVWLDYDSMLDGTNVDELVALAERLPENSALLTTFNALPKNYGETNPERLEELLRIFGDAFPVEQHAEGAGLAKYATFQDVTGSSLLTTLDSASRRAARPGGFVPAFRLPYADGAPMMTVGGFFPDEDRRDAVVELVNSAAWACALAEGIEAPPLTAKEIAALRTLLPAQTPPTRGDLRGLGFDLEDRHLDSFVTHYLNYPVYVQAAR